MSYIGNRPLIGNFVKLDSIASQFNGSTVAFTLKVGGSNTTPGSAQNLIIAVGGVIQEPAVAYNISASTITFTSAPATNATFWGVQLGDVLTIGTPSNGTVGLSQLSATGTPSTTTFHRGDNSWSQIGVSAISATGTPSSTTFLRGDGAWGAVTTSSPTVLTYNSSSTWTKATDVPAGCTMAKVEVWGAGGGGGRNSGANTTGGGGGGSYVTFTVPISTLGATETVTIGAAGLGATTNGKGGDGGTSLFGSWLTAYGGQGGYGLGSSGMYAGIYNSTIVSGVAGGGGTPFQNLYIGSTVDGTNFPQVNQPIPSEYGGNGAGNGYYSGSMVAGCAIYGGGGGGGGSSGAQFVGGKSVFGGAGGAASATPTAGTQPAGGGAGSTSANVNGAAGGAGRVKITMW